MKYLLAALSGFALTLCVFVGGAAFAVTYLTAEEVPVQKPGVDSALVLPTGVVKVNTLQQGFERVKTPPAPEPLPQDEAIEPAPHIDDTTTASFIPEPATRSNDHVNWCADRYRSYRPENNSYTSYSGDTRECVSPFSDDTISQSSSGDSDEEVIYIEASANGAGFGDTEDTVTGDLSVQHIKSCFSRYRSYRPEDNTYQPYGGGPREQCQ